MNDALKYKSMFTLKATRDLTENEKFSNLAITQLIVLFKISYACISTTSVGAMVYLFRFLAKIETEGDGKPP